MSPDIQLDTTQGRPVRLSDHRGKALAIFYEAKGHHDDNAALKDACARLVERGGLDGRFDVLGVADLDGLGFGPVKAMVKRAVTAVAKGYGVSLAMDFDGALEARLGLAGGGSTVALLDPSGAVVFNRSGRLDARDADDFFAALGDALGRRRDSLPNAA
ncbi:MAG: hypothetical protein VYE22_12780 [Myxococcota bacterium]|nr:hypothetical protein [Myxococcota bacterium]